LPLIFVTHEDKNTIIGIVLTGSLFFIFFYYTNKQQQATLAFQKEKSRKDSIANAAKVTPNKKKLQNLIQYGTILWKVNMAGNFSGSANIPEQLVTVENNVVKITFTSKGGRVKSVELKKYNSQTGGKVILGATDKDIIAYSIIREQSLCFNR